MRYTASRTPAAIAEIPRLRPSASARPFSFIVGIVNHNTLAELRACLATLRPHLEHVVVFDNRSTDGSPAMVRDEFPEATLIANPDNLGYGAAANRVFGATDSDVVILCNSDVLFPHGALDRLCEYLETHPHAGLAGPRLLNADGSLQRSCFTLPGSLSWIWDNDVAGPLLQSIPGLRKRLLRLWNHDRERNVPCVKGAVLAIRREAFEDVRGFDESFFMYYEEADLCVRLARQGWQVCFAPVADVVHLEEASTTKVRTAMLAQRFSSCMRFAALHYSRPHTAALFVTWKAIMLVRLLRDRVRLAGARDTARRQRLAEDVSAWTHALRWTFRDLKG